MKITLVEAPDKDLSKLQTPKPKDITNKDALDSIESSEDIKDWDDNLLNANDKNNLTLTQMWLDDHVKDRLLADSSISFLQLVYDWIVSFKTTDTKKNPLLNQLLYVTNDLKYKISYDSLVTLNNAYDTGVIEDKDLMNNTRLGIFQNLDFWAQGGRDQDDYVDMYQYLGDEDGGGRLLDNLLQEYKELNKKEALQLTVFETTQERAKGNLTAQVPYTINWWRDNLDKFRDAIIFVGNVTNLKDYKELKLRPLNIIKDWINKQFNNKSVIKNKRQVSKSQVNQLRDIMDKKGLTNDDVKQIYTVVDEITGDLGAI